jgi:hypothetical protein
VAAAAERSLTVYRPSVRRAFATGFVGGSIAFVLGALVTGGFGQSVTGLLVLPVGLVAFFLVFTRSLELRLADERLVVVRWGRRTRTILPGNVVLTRTSGGGVYIADRTGGDPIRLDPALWDPAVVRQLAADLDVEIGS